MREGPWARIRARWLPRDRRGDSSIILEDRGRELVRRQWQDGMIKLSSERALALFAGKQWAPSALRAAATFATAVHRDFPSVAAQLLGNSWDIAIYSFRNTTAQISSEIAAVDVLLQRLTTLGLGPFVKNQQTKSLTSLAVDVTNLVAAKEELTPFLRYATIESLCLDNPLSKAVILTYQAGGNALLQLTAALDWLVAWTLVRRAADEDRRVFTRPGASLNTLRTNFASADRGNLRKAAELVAVAAHRRTGGRSSRRRWGSRRDRAGPAWPRADRPRRRPTNPSQFGRWYCWWAPWPSAPGHRRGPSATSAPCGGR